MTATPHTSWTISCNAPGCPVFWVSDMETTRDVTRAQARKILRKQGWTTGVGDGSGELKRRLDYCPDHKPEEAPDHAQATTRPATAGNDPGDQPGRAGEQAPRVPARPPASAWLSHREHGPGGDPGPARLTSPQPVVGACLPAGCVGLDGPAGDGGDGAAQAGRPVTSFRSLPLFEPPRGRHAARKNVPRPGAALGGPSAGPGHHFPADHEEVMPLDADRSGALVDVPRSRAQAAGKPGSELSTAHGPGYLTPDEAADELERLSTNPPELNTRLGHTDVLATLLDWVAFAWRWLRRLPCEVAWRLWGERRDRAEQEDALELLPGQGWQSGADRWSASLLRNRADDEQDDYYRQSDTACCPRETIPDSCGCLDGCECICRDCDCGGDEPDDRDPVDGAYADTLTILAAEHEEPSQQAAGRLPATPPPSHAEYGLPPRITGGRNVRAGFWTPRAWPQPGAAA